MKEDSKRNLMGWAIVVLAVMNVSTLITIVYHQKQTEVKETNSAQTPQQLETDSEKFSGRYFRDKLNLNREQMDKFREINPEFRQQARAITIELSLLRKQMLVEMAAQTSDTLKLTMLSDSIGILHSNLKQLTFNYYLDLKNMCNAAQQKQLEKLFAEIFTNDVPMGFPGKGGSGRQQHGRRINQP
jgi:hypothetical protein